MAQYKVPQNVEAEDKILGPLSLRQFIYVIIALLWAFLMWRIFISVPLIAIIAALPVTGVFLALGLIQREEQSFENYFIAMLRFLIVPRKRMWHKDEIRSALKDPARETRPTAPVMQRNPAEVRGQLEKLALVVDTRGRVPKAATIQLPDTDNQASALSARVNRPTTQQKPEAASAKITAGDDILDMQSSQQAAKLDKMLKDAETQAHAQAVAAMKTAAAAAAQTPAPAATAQAPSAQPSTATAATPQPTPAVAPPTPTPPQTAAPVQEQNQGQNDILDLAMSGSNLSVAQIASQANRTAGHLIENQPASLR